MVIKNRREIGNGIEIGSLSRKVRDGMGGRREGERMREGEK